MKRGLSRRNLLKYAGLSGASAVAAGCQNEPEKIIPLLIPPNEFEYVPQQAYQYMTTCHECSAGCGMMVTVREGRAQKAEGNPLHPINKGALCSHGQASMQALYNPERLPLPLKKGGEQTDWDTALKLFQEKVKASQGKIAYVSSNLTATKKKFVSQWLTEVGGRHVVFELFQPDSLKQANEIAFGQAQVPVFAFEEAEYLLNFGADFVESWGSSSEHSRRFAQMRLHTKEHHKVKYVHASPHVSLTGAQSDEWVPIKPGTEGLMALALAYEVRQAKGGYEFLQEYLERYTPDKVASKIGIDAKRIREIAQEIIKASPSLILGGGNLVASEHGVSTLVAVNILNAVAGNLGRTVRFTDNVSEDDNSYKIQNLIQDLEQSQIDLVIFDEVNPVYALPKSANFEALLKKTFTVSLCSAKSETAHVSDLVLATLTPYETWGDAEVRDGVRSISQPVMAPVDVFNAKATEEILLSTAKTIGLESFVNIPTYLAYLQSEWKALSPDQTDAGFRSFWISVLENGGIFRETRESDVELLENVLSFQPQEVSLEGDGFAFLPLPSPMLGDGSGANKPWLQEVPDPMSQIVWDSWLEINPDTAKSLKIGDRDVVEVSTPYGALTLTAYYHFGIHREAVGIQIGQGHTNSGVVADGFGVNALDLLPYQHDKVSGGFSFLSVKAQVKKIPKKSYTVNMDGNARQLGREIAVSITLEELKKGKTYKKGHKRPVEFYPERAKTAGYYKPYRWGMVIDLDRCDGCSACVVACYAENNIPVVGKERMALGREMSWLRMERYIEGFGDNFEVRFIPMGCQHCENAGCETVCPVYATYHNPEGLNIQVYNRCVGTRYCSNNCAYKVRRFNWFQYDFPAPLDQQLNSSITTRDMGVMEKCTWCVQRIKEAQYQAKKLNRDVLDGEVVTACQQTCATNAITFGNLADPESRVSQLAKRRKHEVDSRDRQYEVLSELNFKPAVTYLKKIRFRETEPFGTH